METAVRGPGAEEGGGGGRTWHAALESRCGAIPGRAGWSPQGDREASAHLDLPLAKHSTWAGAELSPKPATCLEPGGPYWTRGQRELGSLCPTGVESHVL